MARFDSWLIAFIVFSLIVTFGGLMVADVNLLHDNVTIDTSDFQDSFDKITRANNVTTNLSTLAVDDLQGSDTDTGDAEDSLFKAGFKTIRNLLFSEDNVFSISISIVSELAQALGVPEVIADVAGTVIIILMFFAAIYLIFRFIPR